MIKRLFAWFKLNDWYLIINTILLMIFSLAALYSLQINVVNPNFTFFNRQLVFSIVGLVIFFLVSAFNFKIWSDYFKVVYIFISLLLIGVLFFGSSVRGTTGWLNIFGQSLQPVELAKVALVIFLAKYFSVYGRKPQLLKNIILTGLAAGFYILLVLWQPDFGSAMILFITWLGLILLLPIRRKTILTIFLIILTLAVGFWAFFMEDYQKERIMTFVNPQLDPLGSGYNVRQSMVAIGSGQLIGRGLALGSQSQLNFLPEQETDFIFAVIAEELGFVGAGLMLLLFFSLLCRIYMVSRKTVDGFGNLLALGFVIYLTCQIFINIGMNMGIAPVTGIPLPLVSYGGSSLISVLIALGIVNSIQIRNKASFFGREE